MILLLLFVAVMAVFFAVITSPETIALSVAGVVAPILTQLLKRFTDASGHLAYAILLIVSLVIAVAALYLSGQFSGPLDVFKATLIVVGVANTVYQFLVKGSASG